MTTRSRSTYGRALAYAPSDGLSTLDLGIRQVDDAEDDGLVWQRLKHLAIEVGLCRLDRHLLDRGVRELGEKGIAPPVGCG